MENLRILPNLHFDLPEKEVFLRLGWNSSRVRADSECAGIIREIARRAFAFCRPQGRYRIVGIRVVTEQGIELENGVFLAGSIFARSCAGCCALWCAAVTVGREITAARDAAESVSDKSVYDAVGSECADAAMDFLHHNSIRELLRSGRDLSVRRYSAGYGDMPLTAQRITDSFLNLADMGVTLNEHDFMIPEKSVTAWAGIRNITGDSQS